MHEKCFNFPNSTSEAKLITKSEVANVSESGWSEEGRVYVWFGIPFYLPFLLLSFRNIKKYAYSNLTTSQNQQESLKFFF